MAHARITRFYDDGTITATDFQEPDYHAKRGKITPPAKANWGTPLDGNSKGHDPDLGRKVLDEALGD